MPTLDKDLVPSSWMTCSALDERQDLLTVQEVSAKELGLMTFAVAILMMLDWDAKRVNTNTAIVGSILNTFN